jgi:serpin B
MRAFIMVALLSGASLLAPACSESTDGPGQDKTPDAAPANSPDTALPGTPDSTPQGTPDVAPLGTPDTAPIGTPDTAPVGSDVPSGEAGSGQGSMASSSLPRAAAELNASEKSDLAATLSGFAFGLLQEVRKDPAAQKNLAFSPTSISLALGMAYAGANGTTASQMTTAMHVTSATDVYLRSLNWLDLQLASRASDALAQAQQQYTRAGSSGAPPDPANYRLHVVNACWGERTLIFEQPYLDTLATSFGSGVHLADFKTQPEAQRLAINAWVSEQTLNRINDLLLPGSIDGNSRAVLVNAIHLKLPWYEPFQVASTAPGTFTKTDGSTVSVPFMSGGAHRLYAEDDTAQVVAMPLSGSAIDFMVLLPKPTSSLAQLEGSLTQDRVQTLIASMTSQSVIVAMPKFTFTTASMDISAQLKALGMTEAFKLNADFTGITKERPLFIAGVDHKAMVGVDENGVEAAAATAVRMSGGAAPTDIKYVTTDRPFFFGIYDRPTSTWLFLGHVTDPSS